MTRAPLRFAPAIKCHRELGPGEVKRVGIRDRLVGYFVGCPACSIVTQAPSESFAELLPLVDVPPGPGIGARARRPTSLTTATPIACRGCGRAITVRGEHVEAAS